MTRLTGRGITSALAGHYLQMEFLDETHLRWTDLAAPEPAETGKSALETADRVDLRDEVVLMAWTEANGSQVVDVFDFGQGKVIANFVMPDGQRFQTVAAFVRQT